MKFLFKFVLPLLLLAVAVIAYLVFQQFTAFKANPITQDVKSFEIVKGSNISKVSKHLEQQKIISSASFFRLLAKITRQDTQIKAGEYTLKKGMTPKQILDLFTKGKTLQYQTRLPEGVTFNDWVKLIKSDKNLTHTLSDDDFKNIMSKLKTPYSDHQPEGLFYPDTYSYPRGTTDIELLQRSHNDMLKLLDEEWEKRTPFKGINTPYDALILASIVEKETGHPEDRAKIARVFLNRLEKGMLLQTDPSVIYGMGENYRGNIQKKDLKKDTPYNTYIRKGLTPTPISIPGAASVKAVFHPAEGDMLFFVAKGKEGKSYFSKTYKEHKKAVIKYLLNGKASRYQGDK